MMIERLRKLREEHNRLVDLYRAATDPYEQTRLSVLVGQSYNAYWAARNDEAPRVAVTEGA